MDDPWARDPTQPLDRSGYVLEVDERFEVLDPGRWLPYHLPHWSSRAAAVARWTTGPDGLRLRIDADQRAWCPDWDGTTRVSSLQTGCTAGPVGGSIGQHRFREGLVVREAQPELRLYTPTHGLFEIRARATDDPRCMVALWMIGLEDVPERSGEICVVEILGREVGRQETLVGMGIHPFGDPSLAEAFTRERLAIDAREPHVYSMEWTPSRVAFWVDDQPVRAIDQSPTYPMQSMLGIYEFREADMPVGPYPKVFAVDWFRGWRRSVPDAPGAPAA
jgi:hypothetical protein